MPLVGSAAKRVGTTVNDRSMNLELFEEVEDSVSEWCDESLPASARASHSEVTG